MSVQPGDSVYKHPGESSSLIDEYGDRVPVSIALIKEHPQVLSADSGEIQDVQCLSGFQIREYPDDGWVERLSKGDIVD
jgi:hypothetical protein